MGENIGDLGGLTMAYTAYKLSLERQGSAGDRRPVTGDQRFFLAWAQVWRSHGAARTTLRQRSMTDPHSPPEFRINGVVRNMDAWYAAFGVKEGDKLYLPPEERVQNLVTGTRRSWFGLRLHMLRRSELAWLIIGLGACVLLWVFLSLASEVAEGETHQFDIAILRALRTPADPSKLIGPAWLEGSLIDVTALGSSTVLGVVILAVVGFLLLQERYQTAGFVGITALSGMLVSTVLKDTFNRPRPSVVPHLRDVVSTSFPSGHAMQSAIVYLTIGAVLMRAADRRATKLYCLGLAMLLTLLVGISRVSLGVHYPTDVIGGWIIGFVWASMCWLIAQRFEPKTGIDAERRKSRAP